MEFRLEGCFASQKWYLHLRNSQHKFSSHTCRQKSLGLTDMDGKIGMFVAVTFVFLHRLCDANVPQLNLQKNDRNKDRSNGRYLCDRLNLPNV